MNEQGSVINICYEAYCSTPTPSPTATPTTNPRECLPGQTESPRYLISNGVIDAYLEPYRTADDIVDLYGYAGRFQANIVSEFPVDNVSLLVVHENTVTGAIGLIVVHRAPKKPNGSDQTRGFTYFTQDFLNLPDAAMIAVKDDGIGTFDETFEAPGNITMMWRYKAPQIDGIAINTTTRNFCMSIFTRRANRDFFWVFGVQSGVVPTGIENLEGSTLSMCYRPICNGTPLPTPSPTPLTPAFGLCANGKKPRWKIEAPGEDVAYIEPYESNVSARPLYGYVKGQKAAIDASLGADNSTLMLVHHDQRRDQYNLLLYVGVPLESDGSTRTEYSYYSMRMRNAPAGSKIPVKDDPQSKYDIMEKETATQLFFQWKLALLSDGVMVNMGTAEFCVDLDVVLNTYTTVWRFLSGNSMTRLSTEYSNRAGKTLSICYDPYCARV